MTDLQTLEAELEAATTARDEAAEAWRVAGDGWDAARATARAAARAEEEAREAAR